MHACFPTCGAHLSLTEPISVPDLVEELGAFKCILPTQHHTATVPELAVQCGQNVRSDLNVGVSVWADFGTSTTQRNEPVGQTFFHAIT